MRKGRRRWELGTGIPSERSRTFPGHHYPLHQSVHQQAPWGLGTQQRASPSPSAQPGGDRGVAGKWRAGAASGRKEPAGQVVVTGQWDPTGPEHSLGCLSGATPAGVMAGWICLISGVREAGPRRPFSLLGPQAAVQAPLF